MYRTLLLGALILSLVAPGCAREQAEQPAEVAAQEAVPAAPGSPRAQQFALPTPPDADFFEITQRLRLRSQEPIPRALRSPAPQRELGQRETFNVTDLQSYTRFQVEAVLRVVSAHAYWYVEQGMEVDQAALERSAQEFESRTYPTDLRYFGDTIRGGFDGDPRLTVLTARFNGAAGYYSSPDEYPRVVHPYSNQRLMLYINGNILRPGTNSFNSVVAHELQHALHRHADGNEESWVNEGLSVLAEELNGFAPFSARLFGRNTDVQLTHWEEEPSANGSHYAAAHLFLRFLGEHWGGYERLKELVAEPKDSVAGIDAYLERLGAPERFRDVFKDWVVANFGGNSPNPRHSYQGLKVQATVSKKVAESTTFSDQVRQYAAKYIEIKPERGAATIGFSGGTTAPLLPAQPPEGQAFWWSNRGDSIDTTLTRAFDLTGVAAATLRFQVWFDIEKGWDYGYVQVSGDEGRTWSILSGAHTSNENPLGHSYGPGFTGVSGGDKEPRWVRESVDLSAYAGKKVLVRFEYITDEGVNANGLALDDIEVPELGFRDDASEDRGWEAWGFLRTDNRVPQEFLVQLLEVRPDGSLAARDLPLDGQQRGQARVCCFGQELERAVVVVAAMAPATTEPAPFQLAVQVGP
ncbi:MAG: immune inhibitor A [Chloroflexi bacterium]|nr:immune inhibitor A [Chloroflexota bacterium]